MICRLAQFTFITGKIVEVIRQFAAIPLLYYLFSFFFLNNILEMKGRRKNIFRFQINFIESVINRRKNNAIGM